MAVFIAFAILLHLIQPQWKEVFLGLLPSSVSSAPMCWDTVQGAS